MKLPAILLRLLLPSALLTGCEIQPLAPEHDPYLEFPAGSTLEIHQAITIPADRASVSIQHGNILQSSPDQYAANCRLIMKEITPIPHTIRPGTFQITGVTRDKGMGGSAYTGITRSHPVEYETIFRLASSQQPEVYSMICRHVEEAVDGQHLTLKQMQNTLAGFISIRLP